MPVWSSRPYASRAFRTRPPPRVLAVDGNGCPSSCTCGLVGSPSRKRTHEWREIAGTLVPDFGLGTAASELDPSLWLAAHKDYELGVLTGLRAQRLVGNDQGRSWRR